MLHGTLKKQQLCEIELRKPQLLTILLRSVTDSPCPAYMVYQYL